jgi:2-dehydropantoate 2-reductase
VVSDRPLKVVVMGAGGVGGYFGAKLARAGAEVTFVARGPHLDALRAKGLTVKSGPEGEHTVAVTATEDLRGHSPVDVVLFCVKSFDTDSAAEAIRPVVGPETAVVSLQNGVDNEERIDAALGRGHALGGVAYVFATIASPGVIAHTIGGKIAFGEMDSSAGPRTERLRDALAKAGIPVDLSRDIRRVLWEKYVLIVPQAGMTALTRGAIGPIRDTPETWAMYRGIVDELVAIAAAEKVGLASDAATTVLTGVQALPPTATSSMYHDVVHGRRLELEALQGHAVRLGERHGIPAPFLFAVYAALKPHARPV